MSSSASDDSLSFTMYYTFMELYEAFHAELIKSGSTEIDVYDDYNCRSNLELPKHGAKSAFQIIKFPNGDISMLVPLSRYKEGQIIESWTITPKPSDESFPKFIEILLLRDGQWILLLPRPEGANKFPTVNIEEAVKKSGLLIPGEPVKKDEPKRVTLFFTVDESQLDATINMLHKQGIDYVNISHDE
jgi:hypothetical protein